MTESPQELVAGHDATALMAIEAIKQLKARYCRYLDQGLGGVASALHR